MKPAVGKSGPFTPRRPVVGSSTMSASMPMFGSSRRRSVASRISVRLCGGMFVAMPTAMPPEPLTRRFGKRAGSTLGSSSDSSKLGTKSTVSLSMSASSSEASRAMRTSV